MLKSHYKSNQTSYLYNLVIINIVKLSIGYESFTTLLQMADMVGSSLVVIL